MAKKTPNPIDKHVGSRVRMRRMMLSMSQEKLGDSLNLTFQQVQKYEKGTNRIGASRLYQIGQILSVPVQFFYDDYGQGEQRPQVDGFAEDSGENVMDFVSSAEGLALNRSYVRITDAAVRRRILDLVRAVAGDALSD